MYASICAYSLEVLGPALFSHAPPGRRPRCASSCLENADRNSSQNLARFVLVVMRRFHAAESSEPAPIATPTIVAISFASASVMTPPFAASIEVWRASARGYACRQIHRQQLPTRFGSIRRGARIRHVHAAGGT